MYEEDYNDDEFDDGYGGFDDGYEYDGFGDEDEFDTFDTTEFQTEMGGYERATIQEDSWYKRMSKVPDIFIKYKLDENTLNLLRKQYKFNMSAYGSFTQGKLQSSGSVVISNYVSYSKISNNSYFSNSEFINNLNPVALCLGHYIRNSDGSVNKTKLKEIKNLLKTKKYTSVTLGNIFRYLRIWNRTFQVTSSTTSIE